MLRTVRNCPSFGSPPIDFTCMANRPKARTATRFVMPAEYSKAITACFRYKKSTRRHVNRTRANTCVRNAALIALAYTAGLKVVELRSLDVTAFDAPSGILTVVNTSGKRRDLPLTGFTRNVLTEWLLRHHGRSPAMFYAESNRGSRSTGRLSSRRICEVVSAVFEATHVGERTPSDLRCSFEELLGAVNPGAAKIPLRLREHILGRRERSSANSIAPSSADIARALAHVAALAPASGYIDGVFIPE